jgi:hypothetical protein
VTLFLLGVLAFACWAVSLYLWPFGPCGKCKGGGRNAGSNKKRFGTCRRCDGSGRRQRFGSKTVHRMVRDTVKYQRKRKDR